MVRGSGEELVVEPETTCPYRALVIGGGVNAFADGTNVYVTSGMMDFVERDAELQFVRAHELAHNGAGHVDARHANTLMGAIIGATTDVALGLPGTMTNIEAEAGQRAYSQDFEREADYLAAYFLARDGADLSGLEGFWRRMGEGTGYQSLQPSEQGSHPSYPERAVRLRAALLEVQGKMQRGEPLIPNVRR